MVSVLKRINKWTTLLLALRGVLVKVRKAVVLLWRMTWLPVKKKKKKSHSTSSSSSSYPPHAPPTSSHTVYSPRLPLLPPEVRPCSWPWRWPLTLGLCRVRPAPGRPWQPCCFSSLADSHWPRTPPPPPRSQSYTHFLPPNTLQSEPTHCGGKVRARNCVCVCVCVLKSGRDGVQLWNRGRQIVRRVRGVCRKGQW